MSVELDNRLRGRTFGIQFVSKSDVQDDDVMLILDTHLVRPRDFPAVMTKAAVSVMEGSEFKRVVACVTDSNLAMKLVEL